MRRTSVLVAAAVALVAAAGWYASSPTRTSALPEDRLVGTWEGRGTVTAEMRFDIPPGQGVPGGKTLDVVTATVTVQARFLSDGTYAWREQHRGGGVTFDFWLPKEGEPQPRWELARGPEGGMGIRLHCGEVPLAFQTDDAFLLAFSERHKMNGTLTFTRAEQRK